MTMILGVKDIVGRAYWKVTTEECAGAQYHTNDVERTKFQALLEEQK